MNELEQLYHRYGAMVLRRCRFLLRNETDAFDATQDVFALVLKKRKSMRFDTPSALLYRIATNVCLNRLRAARRQNKQLAPIDDESMLEEITNDDDLEGATITEKWLSVLFGREPESTKVIAVLHYLDGLTLEQVAKEVGLSVSGVRKRLRKLGQRAKELSGESV